MRQPFDEQHGLVHAEYETKAGGDQDLERISQRGEELIALFERIN